MSHYRTGRTLAAIVVWAGFIGIGLGLLVTAIGVANGQMLAGGPAGMMVVAWGAMAALLGSVSRAIFDIADKVGGPSKVALPESTPIPLSRRDPG